VPQGEREGVTSMTDLNELPANLPVPEDDGAADHLPGTPVPAVTLTSTAGVSMALDQLGEGRTVVYVYSLTGRPDRDLPEGWDSIPGARGCTTEACDFRDHHDQLTDAGAARVYGLSSQDSDYQSELVKRLHLPFDILSDAGLSLAETIGLPTFEWLWRWRAAWCG
jgi:peroxiredoxin